jgi:hypothetical protein
VRGRFTPTGLSLAGSRLAPVLSLPCSVHRVLDIHKHRWNWKGQLTRFHVGKNGFSSEFQRLDRVLGRLSMSAAASVVYDDGNDAEVGGVPRGRQGTFLALRPLPAPSLPTGVGTC